MRPETEAAIRAVRIAQRLADSRAGASQVTSKGGIDLVTATDLACEDAVREELLREFPEYPVIGEERGGAPAGHKPYWLLDPICGTRPFASDVPLYCTNLALVEDGEVTAAAIGIGKTSEILYAESGIGAWLRTADNDRLLKVSDESHTLWMDGNTQRAADAVRRAMLLRRWYVWMFSSSLACAYLAAGRISGIVVHFGGPSPSPHGSVHFAAGCFIAGQAGGIITDLETGGAWNIATRSFVIAASPNLHTELLQLTQSVAE